MKSITFYHPEPEREKTKIIPFFIPFTGCPTRCIYCAQNLQTGTKTKTIALLFEELKQTLCYLEDREIKKVELAFFGGTFTGISRQWMENFLELSLPYKEKGIIKKIRCSTRPDFIDREILTLLKHKGMDRVELGVQSFDSKVLNLSKRGYNTYRAIEACELIKDFGLDLGIQLLPGLPGFSREVWLKDIDTTISLTPNFVRIYPCVVLKNTLLEKKYLKREYTPMGLNESIRLVARGVIKLWRRGIPVIRIGLHSERSLEDNIVAGPWLPSYGSAVKSYILYKVIFTYFLLLHKKVHHLIVPRKYGGELFGHRNFLKDKYKKLGLDKNNIYFKDVQEFILC